MNVYISGPMRHFPEFNFPAFHAAATRLRAEGHVVFSPAERDNEKHGTDISAGNATGDEALAAEQHGFSLREAMREDCAWICDHANAIYLLRGWEHSRGATAEFALARALDLEIFYEPSA
jgi:hypothetical protein